MPIRDPGELDGDMLRLRGGSKETGPAACMGGEWREMGMKRREKAELNVEYVCEQIKTGKQINTIKSQTPTIYLHIATSW